MNTSSSNTGLIAGIIVVTVALFAGLVYVLVKLPSDVSVNQAENVTFNDVADPSVGPTSTPVVVHMYEDFECPACQASNGPLEQAIAAYKDRVRFVWKDFPLESLHPTAHAAADAARCAQAQGKFWEYHDLLFRLRDWIKATDKTGTFAAMAKNITGLDQAAFSACVAANAQDTKVTTTISEGFANKVDATPTFFVNNKRYFGMSFVDWEKILDEALKTAGPVATTSTNAK